MAAADTAYINNAQEPSRLHVKKAGEWEVSIPYALPLVGYGVADSDILSKLYLDELMPVAINNAGTLIKGFVGVVYQNSANYKMHNTARIVELRFDEISGIRRSFFALNDAGLNTYGEVDFQGFDPVVQEIDNIIANGTFKSAYHCDSSSYGLVINSTEIELGTFLARQTQVDMASLGAIPGIGLTMNRVLVKAYIRNEEGTNYSSEYPLFVRPVYYILTTTELQNSSGTLSIRFNLKSNDGQNAVIEDDTIMQIRIHWIDGGEPFYHDEEFILYAGTYQNDFIFDLNTQLGISEADSWEIVSRTPTSFAGAPIYLNPPVSTRWDFTGYDFDAPVDACTIANPVTLYEKQADGLFYKDLGCTILADEGFYSKDGYYYYIYLGEMSGVVGNCSEL